MPSGLWPVATVEGDSGANAPPAPTAYWETLLLNTFET
jgi:hypothetical protein